MTQILSARIRAYLGWCPNAQAGNMRTPHAGRIPVAPKGVADPESPRPGALLPVPADPGWMTAVSIAILFATLFVGGNPWWTAFVLVVLAIFVIIHIRSLRARARS